MSNLTQKNNRCRKNGDKDGKAMHNAVNEKTMKNLRNRIDIRLISNKKKRLFKMDIKTKLHVTKYIWPWFST